ncbi:MAG TPA: hypothetical protein DCE41_16235 [Cytophagales bacterium]|nr:hypothetical protein [Cytophagales bacterium]HAA23612.1 hypothetical protein [Cytophagales bacterium]HAP60754.1 hypothetical protein [Cytophagales bacterium]
MDATTLKHEIKDLIREGDALILIPPGNALDCIPLGAYTLQAVALQKGFKVDILHLDLLLSKWIGIDQYVAVQETVMNAYYQLLMERLFARSAFDLPPLGHHHKALKDQALATHGLTNTNSFNDKATQENIDQLLALEAQCFTFIEVVAEALSKISYPIVGAAIIYENQLLPSLALYRRLKQQSKDAIKLVLGGAYFYEKGREEGVLSIPEVATYVDHLFVGEAEASFLTLLAKKKALPQAVMPQQGMTFQEVPSANYGAYARQVQHIMGETFFREKIRIFWYESNRGCWWADRSHCAFCSIPQGSFRRKSTHLVKEELMHWQAEFPEKVFLFTDNIMAEEFPAEYEACFKEHESRPQVGFQLKVSKDLAKVSDLHQINTRWVMPGIESFSTSLLKRMKKGTTGKHNLYFLRNALSYKISVQYLLLWGFPGDQKAEYEYLLKLIPIICHLRNPDYFTYALVGKGAPMYHEIAAIPGSNLRPWKAYEMIFPEGSDIRKLAHFFTSSFPSMAYEHPELMQQIADQLSAWKEVYLEAQLDLQKVGDGVYLLSDCRLVNNMKRQTTLLTEAQASALMTLCREVDMNVHQQWGLERNLGVMLDGWFVPIITAAPELVEQLDKSYNNSYLKSDGAHENI